MGYNEFYNHFVIILLFVSIQCLFYMALLRPPSHEGGCVVGDCMRQLLNRLFLHFIFLSANQYVVDQVDLTVLTISLCTHAICMKLGPRDVYISPMANPEMY